ncbi:MAG: hypothetical protein WBW35_05170, partial [Xanthobacteraceae bacterium]
SLCQTALIGIEGEKTATPAGFDLAHISAAIFPLQPPRQAHWNRSKKTLLLNSLGKKTKFRQGPSSQKT